MLDTSTAAHALGMRDEEIIAIQDSSAGSLVTTHDGNVYVVADEPDGAGRTGVMYLVPPTPTYAGPLPVYTRPSAPPSVTGMPVVDTPEMRWRNQQLAEAAGTLGVELATAPAPLAVGEESTVEALVDEPGPQPPDDPNADPNAGGGYVPDGTVDDVLAWVGDDQARARQALDAENASDKPRKSLIAQLEPIADKES